MYVVDVRFGVALCCPWRTFSCVKANLTVRQGESVNSSKSFGQLIKDFLKNLFIFLKKLFQVFRELFEAWNKCIIIHACIVSVYGCIDEVFKCSIVYAGCWAGAHVYKSIALRCV